MNTAITLIVSLVVLVSVVWLVAREIHRDRPSNAPGSMFHDWRADALQWRHVGIR